MSIIGKVAIVTGGANGIGFEIVKKFVAHGARGVAIIDLSTNENVEKLEKDRVLFIQADVSEKDELVKAFDKTVKVFKNLDIVINNAGFSDEVHWEASFDVLLRATIRSTYLAMQEYFPKFKSGVEGVIVNTSSIRGIEATDIAPIYSVCKRAVVTLGETLGTEDYYKKYITKVITICPGFTQTRCINFAEKSTKYLLPEIHVPKLLSQNHIIQTAEFLAGKYVEIIEKASNGSIWIVEESKPEYQIVFPSRENMKI